MKPESGRMKRRIAVRGLAEDSRGMMVQVAGGLIAREEAQGLAEDLLRRVRTTYVQVTRRGHVIATAGRPSR